MFLFISATRNNNFKLKGSLEAIASENSLGEFEGICLEDFPLPVYSPTEEGNGVPENALKLTELFSKASGLVVLAPEYNGSIPPILTNAIAWISRSGNEDWRAAFNGKPVVVGTHSGGGGIKVCQAMRSQFEHLGSVVIPRHVVTNFQKELNPDSGKAILTQLKTLSEALSV